MTSIADAALLARLRRQWARRARAHPERVLVGGYCSPDCAAAAAAGLACPAGDAHTRADRFAALGLTAVARRLAPEWNREPLAYARGAMLPLGTVGG